MDEISLEQRDLVQALERRLYPGQIAARRIIEFFARKPDGEPLDERWAQIWPAYRQRAAHLLGPGGLERLERTIGSFTVVDDEIWSLDVAGSTGVTFLLGAGASAPSGIPTVDGLLAVLWERARKIGREDLDRLAVWCGQRRITNIEDLLTTAYIADFAAKSGNITSLLDYFLFSGAREPLEQETYLGRAAGRAELLGVDTSSISFLQDTLQTLFALLTSTMISASPNAIHKAIVDFAAQHEQTSIITTNYDGCMDEAMLRSRQEPAQEGGVSSDGTGLIKMHGSINWAYCDSCQDVREFDLLKLKATYENDSLSYPVLGICKNCGGLRRPLLVPPLSLKFLTFPILIDIWNTARQSIEKAAYLIVVGYSFSESDSYITKIISRSMSKNERQVMVVVNTDRALAKTLRDRFSVHIHGFDEKRILAARTKGEEILPEILQRLSGQRTEDGRGARKTRKRQN